MTVLYVTELSGSPQTGGIEPGAWPPLNEQAIAIPGVSAAFGPNTRVIRVAADSVCSISIGPNVSAAATTQARIAANAPGEYIRVQPGHKIAAVVNT